MRQVTPAVRKSLHQCDPRTGCIDRFGGYDRGAVLRPTGSEQPRGQLSFPGNRRPPIDWVGPAGSDRQSLVDCVQSSRPRACRTCALVKGGNGLPNPSPIKMRTKTSSDRPLVRARSVMRALISVSNEIVSMQVVPSIVEWTVIYGTSLPST